MGNAWTADYLKITGELDVDLRSNIAAEARAKIVYERLINFTDDAGTKDALQFLMTREITHMKAFTAALESLGKPQFSIGRIPPTPGLVDQFFNDSTGAGDDGEIDARGPWNEGGDWEFVDAPAFQDLRRRGRRRTRSRSTTGPPARPGTGNDRGAAGRAAARSSARGRTAGEGAAEDGEGRNTDLLRFASRTTSKKRKAQVERLKEVFTLLGGQPSQNRAREWRACWKKATKSSRKANEKNGGAADLAMIAAAQKVEHYEISAYGRRARWRVRSAGRTSPEFSPNRWPRKKAPTTC